MAFKPRPAQQEVINYQGGKMGVAAVPGSGKTQTLSYLAAEIISSGRLQADQEVLVVTLVNSAVNNFSSRVRQLIGDKGLLPNVGYQVRTLHSLCHDIVRERPGLVGLSDGFQIIDERAADLMLEDVAQAWVKAHPYMADNFLSPTIDGNTRDWVYRDKWPDQVKILARNFIKRAKDFELLPNDVAAHISTIPETLPLADMCYAIYEDYQRALAYRGAVDFDDLIRLAKLALEYDPEYLMRLNHRWPYILEDEAQDSSQLQEQILKMLAGPDENWVRVGDPNQAIYETFTTADPEFLRDFLKQPDVKDVELPNSGRSTLSIIRLANQLIDWTQNDHPVKALRNSLSLPHIEPTPPGDPQPNPDDDPDQIRMIEKGYSPDAEIKAVVDSLERWLPKHPQNTVAVLVPRNDRGAKMAEELKRRRMDYIEILKSTASTRQTAGALSNILNYLGDPKSAKLLATVFRVWRREDRNDEQANTRMLNIAKQIRGCVRLESYLWPQLNQDWLASLDFEGEGGEEAKQLLEDFRLIVRRWQAATLLPIDQLILTLAQDLFKEPAELALAHKLALLLKRASAINAAWRLPELSEELKVIATNERRFLGLSDDDMGFDPDKYKGTVVITTMHRSKGLEWDRVYLLSVNNYDFPSAMEYDQYISESWFIRDQLNLDAETQSQLEHIYNLNHPTGDTDDAKWQEGTATQKARIDYASERLRLLYVGITRAKKELVMTWNTGRRDSDKKTPALPMVALRNFWENQA